MSTIVSSWIGASGAEYLYYIYDINADIPAYHGNYIYAKTANGRDWTPIYFGQGDLSLRGKEDADIYKCVLRKGATHVHLRYNSRPQDRAREVDDLLLRFNNAHAPEGCHGVRQETHVWTGASKENYVFYIYGKDAVLPSRPGVYICAKRSVDQVWTALAVGQGDLSGANGDIARWARDPECTHIHRRLELDEARRIAARNDLTASYLQADPNLQRLES